MKTEDRRQKGMAYRRRQQNQNQSHTSFLTSISVPVPVSNSEEEAADAASPADIHDDDSKKNEFLATKAIRHSSAAHSHRDSSLSSAYNPPPSPTPSSSPPYTPHTPSPSSSLPNHQYTSMKSLNESKPGFWGSLARKAKSILEDDDHPDPPPPPPNPNPNPIPSHQLHSPGTRPPTRQPPPHPKTSSSSRHNQRRSDAPPPLQKGLNAISSSLNYIGNAVEEGLTIVENRTADIIQETRRHIRKKPAQPQATARSAAVGQPPQPQTNRQPPPPKETDQELQLKASRDVAMAMAAKAKLLLRELKTVKADLAFAKERCAQLEEENKILRENHERGESPENDDLIRLQLETLLAEKGRLAHENSVYARENRFLREVVEYHQLTMQDVVYLDEGTEEVTEVYPIKVASNAHSMSSTSPPSSLHIEDSVDTSLPATRDILPHPVPPPGLVEVHHSAAPPSSYSPTSIVLDRIKHSNSSA
ncbi:hypothetical protein Tsubulata_025321 [Turnera subulata]|uniref:Uncharacterized protein n=1 Tax=Turnera subulata TaxID=218843 RepID=A0A9Q0FE91_9ROSI|nr:hypothetical protein Tsubulata_025321 [Turnera subulata]